MALGTPSRLLCAEGACSAETSLSSDTLLVMTLDLMAERARILDMYFLSPGHIRVKGVKVTFRVGNYELGV